MAKYLHLQCPDCNGVFRWMQVRSDDPYPDRCELCGAWMNEDEPPPTVFVPQAPYVKSGAAKAVDDVYEGMVDASKARTELMAQMSGGSASDYQHTVITNLKDAKEGETNYVPPPPNPVQQAMAAQPNLTGHQASAMAFAEANRYGVGAYAGEGARQAVRAQHGRQVAELVSAGNMGSYAGGRK